MMNANGNEEIVNDYGEMKRPPIVRIESRISTGLERTPISGNGLSEPLHPAIAPIVEEIFHPEIDDQGPKRAVLANTRLTSSIGLLIFLELFVIGITIPVVGQLFTLHAIIGFMLIPPLLFKLVSTGYRFFRYYSGAPRYKAAGPPHTLLRVAAPLLVLSTVALMASGVVLMVIGPTASAMNTWKGIHQASFVVWFALTAMHVVSYLPRAVYQMGGEIRLPAIGSFQFSSVRLKGREARLIVVLIAIIFGIVVVSLGYGSIAPWVHLFQTGRLIKVH
ncbi:hypothetical protein [Acidithrix ferrooxidans]|uniref:Cytochrome b561 bacterial/Ni-hydrogenase domain-containing protein n=1 Tax=Acidithrix ferrooxidans TaxID=1280514 RepID=A0A0D8HFG0_9ACTN|nr:hypothetical protein [Acidithrix ferrooxidans]KJF16522.1 hypothetical protein AXFE_25840 [Acidithrix ferrooxidans]